MKIKNFDENMQVKAEDITSISTIMYDNLEIALSKIIGDHSDHVYILDGFTVTQDISPNKNIIIKGGFAIYKGKIIHSEEEKIVQIWDGSGSNYRRDAVCLKPVIIDDLKSKRFFKDPLSGVQKEFDSVITKKTEVEIEVVRNINHVGVDIPDGYIKIAELHVENTARIVINKNIYNVRDFTKWQHKDQKVFRASSHLKREFEIITTAPKHHLYRDENGALKQSNLKEEVSHLEVTGNKYLKTGGLTADSVIANNYLETDRLLAKNFVGMIAMFPVIRVPKGWIPLDGRELKKSSYPELYNYLKDDCGKAQKPDNFMVPDSRGLFVRSWNFIDNGGLILEKNAISTVPGAPNPNDLDDNRDIRSIQDDEVKRHTHTMSTDGNHYHSFRIFSGSYGTTEWGSDQGMDREPKTKTSYTSTTGNHTHTITNTGGDENRVKNIALLYCIFAGR